MLRSTLPLALALALTIASASASTPAAANVAPASLRTQAAALLARNYDEDRPGAAVLVARGDTVLFRGARGLADLESRTRLRPGDVFRIASVTKEFTAAGLLTLVDAGKLGLDDPLSRHLPAFPHAGRITLRQLLNHTAGVHDYTRLEAHMRERATEEMDTAGMIAVFQDQPLDFEPGTRWSYSNSHYVLAAAVIEKVTGQPWHAYLQRALFKPLGMRHTGYAGDPHRVAKHVKGYTRDQQGRLQPMRPLSMSQVHGAGALVSNVDDLLRWNRALHEGRVLKPETYRQMVTPSGAAIPAGYGLGLYVGQVRSQTSLRHGGAIFGFISTLRYLPGTDVTVVVLENDDASDSPEPADTLARRLAAAAAGEPYPELRPVAVDDAALAQAEGVYAFADTQRVLRRAGSGLTVQRGNGPALPLVPIGTDDFLQEDGFDRITLQRDASGRITGMRVFTNGDGAGELGARTESALPAAARGVALPRAALERVVGQYDGGRLSMRVYLEGDALKAQLGGQPPVNLLATSATQFDVAETEATLEFSAGDAPAAQATIRQNGREMVMGRLP